MADTITTLRPDAVVQLGHWSGSPATDLSDNSDATFTSDNATSGTVQLILALGTFSFPARSQIRSVTPRARLSASLAGQSYSFGIREAAGAEAVSVVTTVATPYSDTGAGVPSRPSDGAAWTQSDIDGLQWIAKLPGWSPAATITIYEAYVDVAYNQAPVVSAVLPSGTVDTTNTPPIIWSYLDPEGDPQERFQAKIFDAATIAAPGFNPETSTPALASGETFSATPVWIYSTALTAEVSYTAYVKAADAGSNGRYSAWAAGSPFTITPTAGLLFDAPAIPVVVSATPDPALNRVAVVVQGRDNEATRNQSSAESGSMGWAAVTNIAATYPRRTTTAGTFLHAVAGLQMRSAAAGTMTIRSTSAVTLAALQAEATLVVPGQARTVLASFKSPSVTGRTATLTVTYYDAAAAVVGSPTTGTAITILTSGWTQAAVQATVPTGAVYEVKTITVAGAVAASEDIDVDQIGAAPGTSLVWTRGGFVQPTGTLTDTFDRADSAVSLGTSEGAGTPAWSALAATWGVQSGRAYVVSGAVNAVAVLDTPVAADGVFTVDVTLSPTANQAFCGVVLRAADASNFLLVALAKIGTGSSDAVLLSKNIAGTLTQLAQRTSAGLINGDTYGLKVELFGGYVRVSLDRKDGSGWEQQFEWQLAAADVAQYAGPTNSEYGLWLADGTDDKGSRFDNLSWSNPKTQVVLLERSVDGGVTWVAVRTATRVDLTDPGQLGTFYDYEAPRNTPLQYRARVQASESTVTVTGDYSAALAMTPDLASDGQAWIKSPSDPTLNIAINLIKDTAGSESTEDQAVFNPLGRPDPLIHGGTIRSEYFPELGFMCRNDAEWEALEALRRRQETLLLQTCYGDVSITVAPEIIDGGDADGIPPPTEVIDGGSPSLVSTGLLDGGAPPDVVVVFAPFDEFWIRFGPTRSVSRFTMAPSPGQLRGVRIAAYEVAAPAVT